MRAGSEIFHTHAKFENNPRNCCGSILETKDGGFGQQFGQGALRGNHKIAMYNKYTQTYF